MPRSVSFGCGTGQKISGGARVAWLLKLLTGVRALPGKEYGQSRFLMELAWDAFVQGSVALGVACCRALNEELFFKPGVGIGRVAFMARRVETIGLSPPKCRPKSPVPGGLLVFIIPAVRRALCGAFDTILGLSAAWRISRRRSSLSTRECHGILEWRCCPRQSSDRGAGRLLDFARELPRRPFTSKVGVGTAPDGRRGGRKGCRRQKHCLADSTAPPLYTKLLHACVVQRCLESASRHLVARSGQSFGWQVRADTALQELLDLAGSNVVGASGEHSVPN